MASNLVVLAFEGEHTAENMLVNFRLMEEEGLLEMEDVVLASRGQGTHVEVKQTHSDTGKFTLRGGGIGLAAGLLLGGPIGGLVAGTVVGAIAGALKDYGIDDHFIDELKGYLATIQFDSRSTGQVEWKAVVSWSSVVQPCSSRFGRH